MVPRNGDRLAGGAGGAVLLLLSCAALPPTATALSYRDNKTTLGALTSNFCGVFKIKGGDWKRPVVPPLEMDRYDANGYTETVLAELEKYTTVSYKDYEKNVIFVPGFNADSSSESSVALAKGLVKTNNMLHEVRAFVVEPRFHSTYASAVWTVPRLGREIGELISAKVKNQGYPLEALHLIGHGLGAQVVTWIVEYLLEEKQSGKLGSITLLDPALICEPESKFEKNRLRNISSFVQVYHSSPSAIGMGEPMGDLDVYMASPPECRALTGRHKMMCNHENSIKMFVQSTVEPQVTFQAKKCRDNKKGFDLKSLWSGKKGAAPCSRPRPRFVDEIGFYTRNTTQGIYFYSPR